MKKPATTCTLRLTEEEARCLMAYFAAGQVANPSPYIAFAAKGIGCSVALYAKKDKEGKASAVFQGERAYEEASIFGTSVVAKNAPAKAAKAPSRPRFFHPQIGSDEVGTGDYFGPVVVCASYVDEEGLKILQELGVTDSKKMDDAYIMEIGPRLSLRFDHSLLVLPNEKFNEVFASGINMNAMKAKMHNRCLANVLSRHQGAEIDMDQFAEEGLYYSYLRGEKEVVRGIHMETKGETKFPSVALSSVLARYAFLSAMAKMGEELGEAVPLGAGKAADEFAARLQKRIGKAALRRYVKANFKNYGK